MFDINQGIILPFPYCTQQRIKKGSHLDKFAFNPNTRNLKLVGIFDQFNTLISKMSIRLHKIKKIDDIISNRQVNINLIE